MSDTVIVVRVLRIGSTLRAGPILRQISPSVVRLVPHERPRNSLDQVEIATNDYERLKEPKN